jgi:hypothetical protein
LTESMHRFPPRRSFQQCPRFSPGAPVLSRKKAGMRTGCRPVAFILHFHN